MRKKLKEKLKKLLKLINGAKLIDYQFFKTNFQSTLIFEKSICINHNQFLDWKKSVSLHITKWNWQILWLIPKSGKKGGNHSISSTWKFMHFMQFKGNHFFSLGLLWIWYLCDIELQKYYSSLYFYCDMFAPLAFSSLKILDKNSSTCTSNWKYFLPILLPFVE